MLNVGESGLGMLILQTLYIKSMEEGGFQKIGSGLILELEDIIL